MILVIFNPISGSILTQGIRHRLLERVLPNARTQIERYLTKHQIEYTLIETSPEGSDHIRAAIERLQPDRIIACGGDGTIREVADVLLHNKLTIPLGIVPLGTMNVMALSMNIPFLAWRSIRYAVKYSPVACDVGVLNNTQHFIVACGIGYDAAFIGGTTRPLKKLLGPLSYPIVAVSKAFNHKRVRGTLTTDHGVSTINASWIGCFNIKTLIGYHSFSWVRPHSNTLDIILADRISVLNTLRLSWQLITRQQRTTGPVQNFTTTKLHFVSDEEVECEVDGEVFTSREISLKVIPNALKIVCNDQLFG